MNNSAKPNPMIELTITLIIPSIILMKLSGPEDLGTVNALLLALTFPLFWGARSLLRERKVNMIAVLGLVSILLTGSIGLLQLDTHWLAVKEAAIPGLVGLVVVISAYTSKPLVRVLLFSPTLMNVELIQENLHQRGNAATFETRLKVTTWMLGGSFLFSSAMNYFLATWIVNSPAGTPAFNEELGRMNLLSYPVIALPSMLIMIAVFYYLSRTIYELAGLKLTEAIKH
ncbi:MAG: MFS transporter [Geobacteraceae bacterium]|nr:MFS transporter [Geobacteraceae bacterium]NTW80935.1 MFS transporter [Geobacteraceae bacterium]